MVDFRKVANTFALGVLFVASASMAMAQPAFTCVGNAGVPPLVRAEGLAELVGDVVLNCTGGVPTLAGTNVQQNNIQIFLNTNVTSRLVADPLSEALLMIDEPALANQRPCIPGAATPTSCPITGVGVAGTNTSTNYAGSGVSTPNVFQGRNAAANSIVWLGVPVDPPGSTGTRVLRITNIRANANQLGVSSTLIPTQIVMFISVTGTAQVAINNPQQTVAYIQPGLTFSFTGPADSSTLTTSLQCTSRNVDLSTDGSKTCPQGKVGEAKYVENFASSFKTRTSAVGASADSSPAPATQATPGVLYNSETGFYNPAYASAGNGLGAAGLADHGTRLILRFSNVPAGVVVYVGVYNTTASAATVNTQFTAATASARLVSTDASGAGAFSAVSASSTACLGAIAPVSISSGAGIAVWEVMKADPLQVETLRFNVITAYTAATSSNLPGLGTASVNGTFAPISTVTTQSASAPLPRFADGSTARAAWTIVACSTNLLFPFLTNQLGFDSGIAISNTSSDPFGTAPQQGSCTLNYYGGTTGGGAAPAAQKSGVVAAGAQLVATLSSGGNLGIAATPGFQGYMIAQCAFQFAHGFAFISDVGSNKVAESYLALVMDAQYAGFPRTGVASEVLAH